MAMSTIRFIMLFVLSMDKVLPSVFHKRLYPLQENGIPCRSYINLSPGDRN